jgi:hypothetical protein
VLVLAKLVSAKIIEVFLLVYKNLAGIGFVNVVVDQKLDILGFIMLNLITFRLLGKHFLEWR